MLPSKVDNVSLLRAPPFPTVLPRTAAAFPSDPAIATASPFARGASQPLSEVAEGAASALEPVKSLNFSAVAQALPQSQALAVFTVR